MQPQLVRTARFGKQVYTACVVIFIYDFPIRLCSPPGFEIDLLSGPVWPIGDNRQIDMTSLANRLSPYDRLIYFLGIAFFKLQTKMPLGGFIAGENHHAGCSHVEAVHQ